MRWWRNLALALLATALVLGGGLRPSDLETGRVGPYPGMRAPEIVGPTLNGKPVSLSDLRGKAAFVNFWASWCRPCLEEMPEIHALVRDPLPSTAVLTINATTTESTVDAVAAFLAEHGYTDLPVVLDPNGDVGAKYDIIGLPTSLFISPDGTVVRRITGPMTRNTMESYLRESLAAGGETASRAPGIRWLPDTLPLGPFRLDSGVLFVILGLGATYVLGTVALRLRGLPSVTGDLVSGMALGALLGGKLTALALEPLTYWRSPGLLAAPTFPPPALWGLVAGLLLGTAWEVRRLVRRGISWSGVADALAAPLLAGVGVALAPAHIALTSLAVVAAAGTAWWARTALRSDLPTGIGFTGALLLAGVSVAWADLIRPAGPLPGGMTWVQVAAATVGVAGWWLTGRLDSQSAKGTIS